MGKPNLPLTFVMTDIYKGDARARHNHPRGSGPVDNHQDCFLTIHTQLGRVTQAISSYIKTAAILLLLRNVPISIACCWLCHRRSGLVGSGCDTILSKALRYWPSTILALRGVKKFQSRLSYWKCWSFRFPSSTCAVLPFPFRNALPDRIICHFL